MVRHRLFVAALAVIAGAIAFAAPGQAQTCSISGPTTAAANASFSLCGPTGSGTTYRWYGPGLSSSSASRCVSVSGLSAGTYEYLLILSRNGVEVDRCTQIVNVGGRTGGATSCRISGPTTIADGGSATLCAPNDGIHAYRWSGPGVDGATTSCVTVSQPGTYFLVSRNPITGSSRQCTHRIDADGGVIDDPETGTNCSISGPEVVSVGGSARLCAVSRANTSYRWTGPGGFTATSRCVTVNATGTYTVTLRNLNSGRLDRCTHYVSNPDDQPTDEDPDAVYWDNCPRDLQFWRTAYRQGAANASGLSSSDLQAIARQVDARSTYFNWSNDVQGIRSALSPSTPITRRKQIARQYAALLANMAAGELGVGLQGNNGVSLDGETSIQFSGASTINELVALTDRWLRENRGNFAQLNATLNQINRGRGIGPTCDTP
jgi:hypothetical protein